MLFAGIESKTGRLRDAAIITKPLSVPLGNKNKTLRLLGTPPKLISFPHFFAKPNQVQRDSGKGSGKSSEKVSVKVGETFWRRAKSNSIRFGRKFRKISAKLWYKVVPEVLVQSQARHIRVPEKNPEKIWEALVQGLSYSSRFRKRF